MGLKVTLAGQDISTYVDEPTIAIQDTWGQGPGVGQGSSGRAATATFNVSLGPVSKAIGAGQPLPAPVNKVTANQSSVQTDLTGFSNAVSTLLVSAASTMTRDTTTFWRSPASVKCVHSAGTSNEGIEVKPGITAAAHASVTFSAYVLAPSGGAFRVYDYTNGGSVMGVTVASSPNWQRVSYTYTVGAAATSDLRVALRSSTANSTLWLDGVQAELGTTASAWQLGGVAPATLVRQGEVIVYDANGNKVYGGYASKMDDKTPRHSKQMYTELECVDYWQHLDRINIQSQVYDGQNDLEVLQSLATQYAPWLGLSHLPTAVSYTFGPLNFQNKSLQYAFQKVADTTGHAIWVDDAKNLYYANPYQTQTAPFYLSDTPDKVRSFPHRIEDYSTDDNSAINRVTFYGGKNLTNDFIQDLTNQANGTNTLFTLAYYPHKSSDGKYHVYLSGVDIVVGFDGSTGAANTLKSAGGSADVLINIDNHTLTFNTAPTAAQTPQIKYRREKQMVVVVTDQTSFQFYGTWLDGTISDTTVFDNATAVTRCRTVLSEQSMGLTTFKVVYRQPGLQAGMVLRITNQLQGLNGNFLVQEVETKPLGGGQFEYTATCGAWNWNMVDLLKQAVLANTTQDTSADETSIPVVVEQLPFTTHWTATMSTQTHTMSQYYLRTAKANDGHDAIFGQWSF